MNSTPKGHEIFSNHGIPSNQPTGNLSLPELSHDCNLDHYQENGNHIVIISIDFLESLSSINNHN